MTNEQKVQLILHFLNMKKTRATYKALAEVLSIPAVAVSQYLGQPRPFASWVVSSDPKKNHMPSGYESNCIAPELIHSEVLLDGEALLALISDEI
ncbi:hypothetical protein VST7929_03145 [Vibrio stylophorae]|uniref:Uncharacterized protein n=1 Tax=Vibrio stylophorae TaxID=659351 RepID=A0ABM8ZXY0_9VIBR|nr:hypothetical protein [Vibrio stylophorae]CAH0535620.1 hypothetical protein VST7929_03145 [Vibrio stylophorae]